MENNNRQDKNNGLKIIAIILAVLAVLAMIIAVTAFITYKKVKQNKTDVISENTDNTEAINEIGDSNAADSTATIVINPEDLGVKAADSEEDTESDGPRPRYKDEMTAEELFERFSGDYSFSSGAGGWSTDLNIGSDGKFTVNFHDSEMGDADDTYPNGTYYSGYGDGEFELVERVDEYTYRFNCNLNTTSPTGTEEIQDGIRYIYTDIYGMEGDGSFELILPGKAVSELSPDLVSWLGLNWGVFYPAYINKTVIRNEFSDNGFVLYDYSEDEKIQEVPQSAILENADIYGTYDGVDGSVMYIESNNILTYDDTIFALISFDESKFGEFEYRKNYALKLQNNQYLANEYYGSDGEHTLSEYDPAILVFSEGDNIRIDIYDERGCYYSSYKKR